MVLLFGFYGQFEAARSSSEVIQMFGTVKVFVNVVQEVGSTPLV